MKVGIGIGISHPSRGSAPAESPEILVNPGSPFVDVTGWNQAAGVRSVVSGALVVNPDTNTASRTVAAMDGLSIGATYQVVLANPDAATAWRVTTDLAGASAIVYSGTITPGALFQFTFVATATLMYLSLPVGSAARLSITGASVKLQ